MIRWTSHKICLFLVAVPRLSSSAFCLNLISGKSHRTTLGRKQTQLQTGWWNVTKGWELKAAASKSSENSRNFQGYSMLFCQLATRLYNKENIGYRASIKPWNGDQIDWRFIWASKPVGWFQPPILTNANLPVQVTVQEVVRHSLTAVFVWRAALLSSLSWDLHKMILIHTGKEMNWYVAWYSHENPWIWWVHRISPSKYYSNPENWYLLKQY